MDIDDIAVKYDRKRGVWYARLYMGTNRVTGKPWRPQRDFPEASGEGEALAMAREWFTELTGAAGLDSSMKIADLLARYVDARSYDWVENTVKSYKTCVGWIVPIIGKISAAELTAQNVEDMYGVLLSTGSKSGSALAPGSVKQVHDFLCGFYRWLMRNGIVAVNMVEKVGKPQVRAVGAQALSVPDFSKLKSELYLRMSCKGTTAREVARRTYAFAAWLALVTGMRCGEVCALAVGDVLLERRTVRVRATVVEPRGKPPARQPYAKGGKSRNVQIGEEACRVIREHLEWQDAFLPAGVASDASRTLACRRDGSLMRPTAESHAFHVIAGELGLPAGCTFHTLRHTHATFTLVRGADFRTVQERLGHSDSATTLRLYSHVMPGRDSELAEDFEEMMGGR